MGFNSGFKGLNVVVVIGGDGGATAAAGLVKSRRRLWTEQVSDMGKQEMHTEFLQRNQSENCYYVDSELDRDCDMKVDLGDADCGHSKQMALREF